MEDLLKRPNAQQDSGDEKTQKESSVETESEETRELEVAVLPLQNKVLFPKTVNPLMIGRRRSLAAVEAALETEEKTLACIATKKPDFEGRDADPWELHECGTLVTIKRMMRTEEMMQIMVQGVSRIKVLKWLQEEPYLKALVKVLPEPQIVDPEEVEALKRNIHSLIQSALAMIPNVPPEIRLLIVSPPDPTQLAYFLASVLDLGAEQEQKMLEAETVDELLNITHMALAREIEIMQIRTKIASEAQSEIEKSQRDYILRQQLKAIQRELGEDEESVEKAEIKQLRERLESTDLPEEVRKEAERELQRMQKLPVASPDYHVIRTYLEYVLELPWKKSTQDKLDLEEAKKILDEDHYGLEDIKERILEFLAVVKLRPDSKSPILCFVGPPGVGKTSLGMSIARALGRKFEKISLGGMHDEAELRGHRRTYVGAMPGKIIQILRRCGVNNPVLMLDEIDKLGMDFRGDPASALLEILDPAQNHAFIDNYINLPFDLSKVFFIATANQLAPIPMPLRDRMEIIQLAGYSDSEKLNIAKRYLIPKQIRENGLSSEHIEITDDALKVIITQYTREAGVRQLERSIGNLARKIAFKVAKGDTCKHIIDVEQVKELLGAPRFHPEEARKDLPVGVATGMAWTEMGGEILFVEATLLPGGKGLTLTGHLGDVMKESAQAARSYLWANAEQFGIDPNLIKQNGVHLHVPAGAIPKDGPSAGITMATALASLYTGRKARSDTAMTGEITLSGLVFPVGGIKEKVLAAHRAGIKRIIVPRKNEADIEEIPEDVREKLEFILVDRIDEVLEASLEKEPVKKPTSDESGLAEPVKFQKVNEKETSET